jgi:hypothetical protein
MRTMRDVRSHDFCTPAPDARGAEVRSLAFAEATLAATDCVVPIDQTAIGGHRVTSPIVASGDTRQALPRNGQDAEKVVTL